MDNSNLLLDYIKTLKDAGFKVYTSDNKEIPTYCYFVKDDKIGYVQDDYFGGLSFSTVHMGGKEFGTGFGLTERGIVEPTLKDAYSCFILAPNWAKGNISIIKKYKSWEDYTARPINQILKHREL
jgi:hypothetical protein